MVISKEVVAIVSSGVAVLLMLYTELTFGCKRTIIEKRKKEITGTDTVESEYGRESSPEKKT